MSKHFLGEGALSILCAQVPMELYEPEGGAGPHTSQGPGTRSANNWRVRAYCLVVAISG